MPLGRMLYCLFFFFIVCHSKHQRGLFEAGFATRDFSVSAICSLPSLSFISECSLSNSSLQEWRYSEWGDWQGKPLCFHFLGQKDNYKCTYFCGYSSLISLQRLQDFIDCKIYNNIHSGKDSCPLTAVTKQTNKQRKKKNKKQTNKNSQPSPPK